MKRWIKRYMCTISVYIPIVIVAVVLVDHDQVIFYIGVVSGILLSVGLLVDDTREKESRNT